MLELISEQQLANKDINDLMAQKNSYIANSKADNTKRAYQSDWNHYVEWCNNFNLYSLPATSETVSLYITWLIENGYKIATLERKLSSISKAHQFAGFESPTRTSEVAELLDGIKREKGTKQIHKKAIITEDMIKMLSTLSDDISGIRDKALLLVGYAGAFRRSELVNVDIEHMSFYSSGIEITIPYSKTNQYGDDEVKFINYGENSSVCPVRALKKWLEIANITDGAVFRNTKYGRVGNRLCDKSVADIVKRCAKDAGLDPKLYAGHSLRSGFVTQASMNGAQEWDIMMQTGHKSVTTLRRYRQDGERIVKGVSRYLKL